MTHTCEQPLCVSPTKGSEKLLALADFGEQKELKFAAVEAGLEVERAEFNSRLLPDLLYDLASLHLNSFSLLSITFPFRCEVRKAKHTY